VAIVDSHQHFWDPDRVDYPWLASFHALDRAFGFDDLAPHLRARQVDATVVVQCGDFPEDNDAMFEIADQHDEIAGVIAWIPLDRPGDAEPLLSALSRRRGFVGVRDQIHMRSDPDWILGPEVGKSLGMLEAARVPFDLVSVLPRHLDHVPVLCERHPELVIVIDHLSKPPIGGHDLAPWTAQLARAAEFPNVRAKVSGLYGPGDQPERWTEHEIRPVVHVAAELFGPARLMFGSDWPVCETAGGYELVADALFGVFAEFTPDERDAMLGATAIGTYGLEVGSA
jgi:L-fuconolactonase